MKPFDIYLAEHPWRKSDYARPFLLIRPTDGGAWSCFPMSTKDYDESPFEVNKNDPDFSATGLSDTSYIHDYRYEDVKTEEILKRKGQLEGDLLSRFRAEAGV